MFKSLAIFLLVFVANAEGKTIECLFESSTWLFDHGTHYTCAIRSNPNITQYLHEDVKFIGTHASGKTNNEVTGFSCDYECQMHYFPRGLEKVFKNLIAIYMYKCELSKLYQDDLQHFDKLEVLYFPHNKIEVLEENLFAGNPKLRVLWLYGNKIKFIHNKALENVKNLKNLDLRFNACINKEAVNNTAEVNQVLQSARNQCTSDVNVYELHQKDKRDERKKLEDWKKEVQELKVKNYDLDKTIKERDQAIIIHQERIKNLEAQVKTLKELFFRIELTCLADNGTICHLKDVHVKDDKQFVGNVKNLNSNEFTEVIVSNQEMSVVPQKFSQFFTKITKLTVTDSNLKELNSNELKNLIDLEVLKIIQNNIQKVDFVLPWTKLEILDLSFNKIESLASGSFDRLTALHELYLNHNALSSLPWKIFEKLANLQVLSLDENQLQVLVYNVIPCRNEIKEFSASGNKLRKIDVKIVRCLMSADRINLSGNTCIDSEYFKEESSNFATYVGSVVVSCTGI